MLLIPIEKLKNGRDSFRQAREAHLIVKAHAPRRLWETRMSAEIFIAQAMHRVNYICCSGDVL